MQNLGGLGCARARGGGHKVGTKTYSQACMVESACTRRLPLKARQSVAGSPEAFRLALETAESKKGGAAGQPCSVCSVFPFASVCPFHIPQGRSASPQLPAMRTQQRCKQEADPGLCSGPAGPTQERYKQPARALGERAGHDLVEPRGPAETSHFGPNAGEPRY